MADVAFVFHWPPDAMYAMELPELLRWRGLAVERHNAVNSSAE
ncbi:MAG: GpE family phage tail protein [Comamonas sp.]|nr:GpE family phage tail protein [Comamonas sp.]